MPIQVVCNGCGTSYPVPDSLAGKRGRCKKCGQVMVVPAAAPPAPTAAPVTIEVIEETPPAPGLAATPTSGSPQPPRRGRRVFLVGIVAGLAVALVVFVGSKLVGPGSVTEENFRKLKWGMTLAEVEGVLGRSREAPESDVPLDLRARTMLLGIKQWRRWEGGPNSITVGLSGNDEPFNVTVLQFAETSPGPDGTILVKTDQKIASAMFGLAGLNPGQNLPVQLPNVQLPPADPKGGAAPAGKMQIDAATLGKLRRGMTEAEAIAILGPPTETVDMSGQRVTEGAPRMNMKRLIWRDGEQIAFVGIVNGKVTVWGSEGGAVGGLTLGGLPGMPQDLAGALKNLQSPEPLFLRFGIEWLAKAPVDETQKPAVEKALTDLIAKHKNTREAGMAVTAVARWGTPASVPMLIQLVEGGDLLNRDKDPHYYVRHPAILTLGKLKDPRALLPIARLIPDENYGEAAGKALAEMGPVAEKAVLPYMNYPNRETAAIARGVLESYKTQPEVLVAQCLADLGDKNAHRKHLAAQALGKVQPIDAFRKRVVAALLTLAKSPPPEQALELDGTEFCIALGVWATKDDLPALIRLMEDEELNLQAAGIDMLAKIPDEKSATAIAQYLGEVGVRGMKARKALEGMGAVAELPVFDCLGAEKAERVRIAACQVLAVIGTRNSLLVLAKLSQDMKAVRVAQAASDAVQAINARIGGK